MKNKKMKQNNKLVKDYKGNLIPKSTSRKIGEKYYEEGKSCFLMEDGQWYRITSTDKIIYDHYKETYTLVNSTKLIEGIINEKGELGKFSENDFYVMCRNKQDKKTGNYSLILNEKIAEKLGYIESIGDGFFYPKEDITEDDMKTWFNKKTIPNSERSKNYNLESDPERKTQLEKCYKELNIKPSLISKKIAGWVGDYSFGMEAEVINGFIPKRIRSIYGIKVLKDGSLRHDGGEGLELVTMPMSGAKGVEVIRKFCQQLSKRCEVNNLCSVHFHFGNVRKDKLYVITLHRIIRLIQKELVNYFPFSRFNSVRQDGKVYCKLLDDLEINYNEILKCDSEESFHKTVVEEFNKIYKWLNNGKGLAENAEEPRIVRETTIVNGKKMFYDKWLKKVFTTKSVNHSVQGQKWDKPQRYMNFNFLNLFFSNIGTIEARIHEGSTNSTKVLIWFAVCASILKYAEDIKRGLTIRELTLSDILKENMSEEYTNYIMAYMKLRNEFFFSPTGQYRANYKSIENNWFKNDSEFTFKLNNIEIK